MKVIFCAYDRPGHIASGPNVWLKRLIPDLVQAGFDMHTLFIHSGSETECPTIQFFKTNRLAFSALSSDHKPWIEDQIRWILRESRQFRPDVLVANLVAPAFYTPLYLKNIPVIAVVHSNDPFYHSLLSNFYRDFSKCKIDVLVAVSDYLSGVALKLNPSGIIRKISCGTPVSRYRAGFDDNVLRIAYFGRITEKQKQISELTKSFCTLSKISNHLEFSIYGDGEAVESVLSVIDTFKAGDKVKYKGSVSPDKVQEIMSEHQVFTLMSDYEGLPVALLEAMSCGLVPVCLSEPSGINEVIQDGVNGMIVRDREESYFNAILRLSRDRKLWEQLSELAIKTVEKEYSSEINHQRWIELINSFSEQNSVKKFKIPIYIDLSDIPPLVYGDYRKPSFKTQLTNAIKKNWMQFRLFVRPRTRLRKLLKLR